MLKNLKFSGGCAKQINNYKTSLMRWSKSVRGPAFGMKEIRVDSVSKRRDSHVIS